MPQVSMVKQLSIIHEPVAPTGAFHRLIGPRLKIYNCKPPVPEKVVVFEHNVIAVIRPAVF